LAIARQWNGVEWQLNGCEKEFALIRAFSKILWPSVSSVGAAGGRAFCPAVIDRGYSSPKNALVSISG
jgi:hypothetical protein